MNIKSKILSHPAVSGLEKDDDDWGYWCYLKTDYIYPEMECSLIHEQTFERILECLRTVIQKFRVGDVVVYKSFGEDCSATILKFKKDMYGKEDKVLIKPCNQRTNRCVKLKNIRIK